jgi:pimeloyl-ACP methyl ester carboxylesterase
MTPNRETDLVPLADAITPPPDEITIDGRRLELQRIPAAATGRPTIVMLHEGLGSVSLWRDFPAQVAARTGCAVLAYSRWGHGRSEVLSGKRPVGYMHREAEVVLPALLAALDIRQPILLGHSDGASIALIFAGLFPAVPRALILEAPHVFVEDVSIAGIAAAKEAFATTDLRHRLGRHHADPDATFRGWNDIWLDPAFRDWNIENALPAIRCPVLLIQGEDDEYGTPAQLDAIRAGTGTAEILLLPRCRHSPHRDQPAAVLDRISSFVAGLA